MITVISLGTARGELTLKGLNALRSADEVCIRTAAAPSSKTLDDEKIPYSSFDDLYERCRNYDTLTRRIVREVRSRARGGKNVAYCVDGGVFEDAAARILLTKKTVKYIDGPTKAGRIAALAGLEH